MKFWFQIKIIKKIEEKYNNKNNNKNKIELK